MKQYDAVIAGYTCVDMMPVFKKDVTITNVSDLFIPGKLIEVEGLDFVLGGAVPNTGLAMKQFNKRVYLNGLVGDDFVGPLVKEWLGKNDAADGIVTTKDAGTAYSIVLAPPGIDRIFLESPGCNRIFNTTFINLDIITKSIIYHFGYPPLLREFYLDNGRELSEMFSKVQKMGVVTSLDFSLPDPESESGKVNWPVVLQKTLPFVDIFVPSLEETIQIMLPGKYAELRSEAGNSSVDEIVPVSLIRETGRLIIDSGVKILMIKAGSRGAYFITGDVSSVCKKRGMTIDAEEWSFKEFWCSTYPVDPSDIINASGAGDTANAGFLSAILDGEPPEMAAKYAAIAGRNNLFSKGNFNDRISWQEMKEDIMSYPDIINYF